MKKFLIITLLLVLLVSCGVKNTENKIEKKQTQKQEVQEQKYKDITKYVKSNITDEESQELLKILKQREERQAEVKKMIEEATKENKDEVYKKIVEKRKTCMNRILPYVDENKKKSFISYCEKINVAIKKKLDTK